MTIISKSAGSGWKLPRKQRDEEYPMKGYDRLEDSPLLLHIQSQGGPSLDIAHWSLEIGLKGQSGTSQGQMKSKTISLKRNFRQFPNRLCLQGRMITCVDVEQHVTVETGSAQPEVIYVG